MAIAAAKAAKGIAVEAPLGGISAQLGEKSFPLLLRNGEIERFEEHRQMGIFALLDAILQNTARVTHCRDLVALGLVGAGMSDAEADRTVSDLPPQANMALKGVARELIFAAFADPETGKKKGGKVGSSKTATDAVPMTAPSTSKTR